MYEDEMTTSDETVIKPTRTRTMQYSATMLLLMAACVWLGVLGSARSEDKTVPDEVKASRFVVVDNTGKERAEFGIMKNGQTGMAIKDKGTAVFVGMDRLGMPTVALENSQSQVLLEMGILEDRSPVFVLRDAEGRRRLGAIVTGQGAASIGLYDVNRIQRCGISLGQDGHPQITLKDRKGKLRASIAVLNDGTCALDLFDQKGKERVVFQVDAKDQADAVVFGSDGKPTWFAGKP